MITPFERQVAGLVLKNLSPAEICRLEETVLRELTCRELVRILSENDKLYKASRKLARKCDQLAQTDLFSQQVPRKWKLDHEENFTREFKE